MSIISNLGRGRAALAAAAAVSVAAAAPAAANAATVAVVGDHIEYRAAPGEVNQLDLGQAGSTYAISDRVSNMFAGAGCVPIDAKRVHCSLSGVRFVSIEVGDGNDTVDSIGDLAGFQTPTITQLLNGNAGKDVLIAGLGANVVVGAEGDDTLFGNTGNDNMAGNAGNDTLFPNTGADTVSGGTGIDKASYITHPGPVVVSLDGNANDGAGREGDSVGTDIEALQGSPKGDVLRGNASIDRFSGSTGNDTYFGFAGNDIYDADGDLGADVFHGGAGGLDSVSYADRSEALRISLDGLANDGAANERDDILPDVERVTGGQGADTLIGSRGADTLSGSGGSDLITPDDGADNVSGGTGNDRIRLRDGERDFANCGPGSDQVELDRGVDNVVC